VVSRLRPNRIDRPGTGQEARDSWPALRHLPAVDPLAWSSVVVVAAHPDDEVLGVGGTMAMLAGAEARLRLIALTDGEASHPGEDPEVIARTRVAESAAALGVLGATSAELIRLRLPDTGLAAREDELVGLLRGAFASQLTGRAAARRTRDLPHVRVEQRQIPAQWPAGRFDLIVFSEILYYFGDGDLDRVLDRAVRALQPGGTLLAVHWRHPVAEYPGTGDDVHQVLAARPGVARLVSHTEPDFLAEVYTRTGAVPISVAQATGLV
jgi:SAM-dependent methyltransferase